MDDREDVEPTPVLSDAELGSQLRVYAQALAATRGDRAQAPAAPTPVVDIVGIRTTGGRRRRRAQLAAATVAAAAAIALGAAGWWAAGRNAASVSADDPAPPTTGTTEPVATPTTEGEAGVHLLPDLSAWAVSDHSADPTGPPTDQPGIWVWRLDGHLIILSQGVFVDQPAPRSEATVDVSNERTSLSWTDDGVGFDLQGLGVDEAALRAALATLTQVGDGWDLPGADPVASETAGPGETGVVEQVTLVPRDGAGVPVLASQVQSTTRPGSAADLFRELHEAGGAGDVTETTIAGRPGFIIDGPDFGYALVAIDGWVVNWSTTAYGSDVDLAALLASTRAVSAEDWDVAIAGIDATLGEVVAAADVDPVDDAAGAEPLPRYVLPGPWTLEWVTDMGLWTPEQRAQRQALAAANTPAGASTARTVRAQGFRSTSSPELPIAVPEVTLEVTAYDGEAAPGPFAEAGGEPITVAGLQGTIYPPGTVSGWGAGIELAGGQLAVSVRTTGMTLDELRAFARGLTVEGNDPAAGFSLGSSSGYREVYDLDGDQVHEWNPSSFWIAAWRGSGGEGSGPAIEVERLTLGQLQQQLGRTTSGGTALSSAGGGRYLAMTTPDLAMVTAAGSTASTFLVNGASPTERSTVVGYDPQRQLAISLTVNGTVDDALDLMGQLTEVDLASWESLVAPVNADPLHPR